MLRSCDMERLVANSEEPPKLKKIAQEDTDNGDVCMQAEK